MKKTLSLIFIFCLMISLISACSDSSFSSSGKASTSSASSSEAANDTAKESASKAKDASVTYDVFLIDKTEEYEDYQIVYGTSKTNKLKAVTIESHFFKSAGYTKEDVEALDIKDLFQGFSEMDFASYYIKDDNDDFVSCVVKFEELDKKENLKKVVDNGILVFEYSESDLATAVSYKKSLLSQEAQRLTESAYKKLGLHFD